MPRPGLIQLPGICHEVQRCHLVGSPTDRGIPLEIRQNPSSLLCGDLRHQSRRSARSVDQSCRHRLAPADLLEPLHTSFYLLRP